MMINYCRITILCAVFYASLYCPALKDRSASSQATQSTQAAQPVQEQSGNEEVVKAAPTKQGLGGNISSEERVKHINFLLDQAKKDIETIKILIKEYKRDYPTSIAKMNDWNKKLKELIK